MCTYLLLELFKSQIQGQQQTQTIIKKKKIKPCAPFTDCISEINNTGIDNAKNQCQIPNERKNISQEFRLKFINETRNSFLEEIDQNEFISRKHNKVCTILNCIEHFLILGSTIVGCISISAFAF